MCLSEGNVLLAEENRDITCLPSICYLFFQVDTIVHDGSGRLGHSL